MKTSNLITSLTVSSVLLFATSAVHAQGSLTPPAGVPAPNMKSLDQVEARTPVVAGAPGVSTGNGWAFQITKPGSYYLTADVIVTNASAGGIDLGANDVTLDLNGFSIIKTVGNGGYYGVRLDDTTGQTVVIRNGHISGANTNAGFGYAIYGAFTAGNVTVQNVTINDSPGGIYLSVNGDSTVQNCSARRVGVKPIYASLVKNCRVVDCSDTGIAGTVVSDCYVSLSSGTGAGISVSAQGSVMNCHSEAVGGNGISAGNVSNSYGESTGGVGIVAVGTASFCRGARVGGTAITAGIAIGCTASSGTVNSTQKHLGTP